MKRILTLLVALTIAVAFGGMTFAGEEKKAEPAKPAAAPVKTVRGGTGEVTAVDVNAKTITVKTKKGKEFVIAITEDSEITVGKETKTLDQVKVGEKVMVRVVKPAKKIKKKEERKEEKKEEKK